MDTIDGRISVNLYPSHFEDPDDFNAKAMEVVLDQAFLIAKNTNKPIVWVEVEYRRRDNDEWEDWDTTGDALEIDFSKGAPLVRTLSSDEWAGAVR